MLLTVLTEVEHKSELVFTTDTLYLPLMGELWGVCCEEFWKNWLCYNSTALYITNWVLTTREARAEVTDCLQRCLLASGYLVLGYDLPVTQDNSAHKLHHRLSTACLVIQIDGYHMWVKIWIVCFHKTSFDRYCCSLSGRHCIFVPQFATGVTINWYIEKSYRQC